MGNKCFEILKWKNLGTIKKVICHLSLSPPPPKELKFVKSDRWHNLCFITKEDVIKERVNKLKIAQKNKSSDVFWNFAYYLWGTFQVLPISWYI